MPIEIAEEDLVSSSVPRRRIGLVAIVGAAALVLGACGGSSTDEPIRIGTNVWPGYEPLYLARDRGDFGEAPIQLVEYLSASEVLRAYRNGAIDGAALTLDELARLAETSADVHAVLVTDISMGADVLLADPTITTLSALRGKRIGVETTALGAYVLHRALERARLREEDVEVVPLEVVEHVDAFERGRVDAVVTFEPAASRIRAAGGRELFDSADIPGEIIDVVAVRASVLEDRQADVEQLLRGWFAALEYLRTNRDDALARMAPREHVSPAQLGAAYEGLELPDAERNLALLEEELPGVLARLERVMLDGGIIQRPVSDEALFEPEPLRALVEP